MDRENRLSEDQASQATRHDLAEGMRKHYNDVMGIAHPWNSGIPHAIDLWEKYPELEAELTKARGEIKHLQDLDWYYRDNQKNMDVIRQLCGDLRMLRLSGGEISLRLERIEAIYESKSIESEQQKREIDLATKEINRLNGVGDKLRDEIEELKKQAKECVELQRPNH